MEYKVIRSFKGSPDGMRVVEYEKGQVVSLTESLAVVALEEKWVRPHKPEPELDPAKLEKVAAVIGQLNPENEEHYTNAGTPDTRHPGHPDTRALGALLDFTPSAAERDAAFALFQEQQGGDES